MPPITGQFERHRTDILFLVVDAEADIYDSTLAWCERVPTGILNGGSLVKEERSSKRTEL